MLRQLHIKNLAIIEDATVDLAEGLNVFTGETGAGKSLVIGAFELLLGLRTASGMLRGGSQEGRVSGVFEMDDPAVGRAVSALLDTPLEPDDPVLITRKLFASGRSSVSVNGQPVTTGMLKQVGRLLVDIHGQHDHQYLLRPSNQRQVLDGFAGCEALRESFGEAYQRLRALVEQREGLTASTTLRQQQLELYRFQAQEIDAAEPMAGEFAELQARHGLLSNMHKLQTQAGQVHQALYEADGSILERLQALTHVLIDLGELDERGVGPIAEEVRSATIALQEQAFELSRYQQNLELDPHELAEIQERLNILNRLAAKYGDGARVEDPLEQVLAYREQIQGELDRLTAEDQDLSGIDQAITRTELDLQKIGKALTQARQQAADVLVPRIEQELQALGMPEARLQVLIEPLAASEAGPSGLDSVVFLVQTNPGQGFAPLREVASGGELSRVMLSLKSVLAGSDRISVLVFDEIDSNIGGRLGSVIGQKLKALTGRGSHQVLCITHLPQIAAFGDRHLKIAKAVSGQGQAKQTRTTVTELVDRARIDELAEMMAGTGATSTTRKQAKELIAAAKV